MIVEQQKTSLQKEIHTWLTERAFFADSISQTEFIMQQIYFDYPKYEGKQEDQKEIANNCKTVEDAYYYVQSHKLNVDKICKIRNTASLKSVKTNVVEKIAKVVVINGAATVGKSTFISLCHEINPTVIETSTVDFVKKIALQAGWDGIKDEAGRRLLSELKDAMEHYHDIPNANVDEFIQSHPDNVIFVNAREPHNVQHYVDKYGAVTVMVINPNAAQVQGNHADEGVYDYIYDYYIENSGDLETLKESAKIFLDILKNL